VGVLRSDSFIKNTNTHTHPTTFQRILARNEWKML
jgi:hypothetical protein